MVPGGHMPEKIVAEGINALVRVEFFPCAGIDVLVDALEVEEAFDGDEVVGIEADVVDVVVPARMLSEGGEMDGGLGFDGAQHSSEVFEKRQRNSGRREGTKVQGSRVQGSKGLRVGKKEMLFLGKHPCTLNRCTLAP